MPRRAPPAMPPENPFLSFVQVAVDAIARREPGVDRESMRLVLLLHRVTNSIVYDLESTVHRPAGWSWAAFRLLFSLWVTGPLEANRAATTAGMSRPAVTALVRTLEREGLVQKLADPSDGRSVVVALTGTGQDRLTEAYRAHNAREQQWMSVLTSHERDMLAGILTKLSHAAEQEWVSRR